MGVPPVPPGTPPAIAGKIVGVAHGTFISGMGLACLVAAGVAVVAVFVALLPSAARTPTRERGRPASDVNRVRTTAPPGRLGGAVAYPGDLPRAPLPAATTAGQGAVK